MDLQTLQSLLYDFPRKVAENPTITSIETNSRDVKQGSLFICIKGYTVDGHDFAQEAINKGAVAVIAEKPLDVDVPVVVVQDTTRAVSVIADAFYDQPTKRFRLIGVTGTNGKTTTTHIIEEVFQHAGQNTGLIGTNTIKINNQTYGVKNTTPEALTLQKTFNEMVDNQVDTAIMEVSSHALDLGRTFGCDFDVAVFTNLTQDHLDYHDTMAEYRRTKGLLFAQLGNSYNHSNPKYAILNADDHASDEFRRSTAATVITYGVENRSDFMAKHIKMTPSGTKFELITPYETFKVSMKLIGLFNAYNVLAATAACFVSGISLSSIISTIETLEGVSGRFEVVDGGQDYTVIVDYAHTPDSLENVLKTINEFASSDVYVVVGCGGDRDRTKRPLMAMVAEKYSNLPIFTSDNPRSEDPEKILAEMEEGVKGKDYTSIIDRKEAISYAIGHAKKNDIVLIAGKGHETYQEIGDQRLDFDDREIVLQLIKERL
ncbi:UDP-N-acetylmuramoyl-L-alanyl-D-glutamate--2,6-diaminopimelate ligase [Cytobacillus sp. IB215665]|uniref:UDP-N-acetylmuramoyl-L-alanyl-D-glutamate--2, 6-diaminopimelate ligase n=1 Tax=Cytobacillus sp. IB215665 TaxID=3097357 RepID=UPI002A180A2E|nr:UDP-N-acetylmuramoyl-L-alanyl-D-glutamate--2,6-diaminopimelate ligase [Cytobacillus sp. IB215665]MDX8364968.1 UDP-N-acetylmuramoyl-L-alanyl-D-glutamate--2,6-diaminopimelate ligase [Cytobacillus sp. IB215665]